MPTSSWRKDCQDGKIFTFWQSGCRPEFAIMKGMDGNIVRPFSAGLSFRDIKKPGIISISVPGAKNFFHEGDTSVEVFPDQWLRVYRGGEKTPLETLAVNLRNFKATWKKGNSDPRTDRLFLLESDPAVKSLLSRAKEILRQKGIEFPQSPVGYREVCSWLKKACMRPGIGPENLKPGMMAVRIDYSNSSNGYDGAQCFQVESLDRYEKGHTMGWYVYKIKSHPVLKDGIVIRLQSGFTFPEIYPYRNQELWIWEEAKVFPLAPEDMKLLSEIRTELPPDHSSYHLGLLAGKRLAAFLPDEQRSLPAKPDRFGRVSLFGDVAI